MTADTDSLIGLVRRMAKGDQDALARIYELTKRRAYGLALHILRDAGAAEEATLTAYEQVWRTADRFESGRGSVLTWILTIARTRSLDRLRRLRRDTGRESAFDASIVLQDSAPRPDEASEAAEAVAHVRAAVASLPDEQRVLIEAAYFQGLSYTQVAQTLGQPVGTVKTRIRAGMGTLRDVLEGVAL